MRRRFLTALLLSIVLLLLPLAASSASGGLTTVMVSLTSSGVQGNLDSQGPCISDNGRYVAFSSYATNFSPSGEDTNTTGDVFVRDLASGQTERISVNASGKGANQQSFAGPVSDDGRYVAFQSYASNLCTGNPGFPDSHVFLRDRLTHVTSCVSVNTSGTEADDTCEMPDMSADGRYVVFESMATNLVTPLDWVDRHIYRHDNKTGVTVMADVSSSGVQARGYNVVEPRVSADGNRVVFRTPCSNLVTETLNGAVHAYLHDFSSGETTLVSVNTSGDQINADCDMVEISADGMHVAFKTAATNISPGVVPNSYNIYMRDLATGQTVLVSATTTGVPSTKWNCWTSAPVMSGDGRYVAFTSLDTLLVPGDTNGEEDVFLRDTLLGQTSRASLTAGGNQANGISGAPSISADGSRVAFDSAATNLVSPDANNWRDVFVRGSFDTTVTPPTGTADTTLTLDSGPSVVNYLGNATFKGTLTTTSGPLAGRTDVDLFASANAGATWSKVADAVSSGGGAYTASHRPDVNKLYEMRFAGDSTYEAAVSNRRLTKCRAYLSKPVAPSRVRRGHYFTTYGFLKPRHAGKTKLYFYRKVRRTYKLYKMLWAPNRNYSSYTKYSLRFKLPYATAWRVKAYHSDGNHAATWSAYRSFTVR